MLASRLRGSLRSLEAQSAWRFWRSFAFQLTCRLQAMARLGGQKGKNNTPSGYQLYCCIYTFCLPLAFANSSINAANASNSVRRLFHKVGNVDINPAILSGARFVV